jgi:hypothetical protein
LKNAGNKLEQQYKNRERRRRKREREREEEEHSVKFKVGWLGFLPERTSEVMGKSDVSTFTKSGRNHVAELPSLTQFHWSKTFFIVLGG